MNDLEPAAGPQVPAVSPRLGPRALLALAAGCGLLAGELEVAARVGYRALSPTNCLYLMTRHFVWLVPLIDLAVFVALGGVLALAARRRPRSAGWLAPRLLVALALLPALSLAGRGVYVEAWGVLALGVAVRVVPALERRPAGARRVAAWAAAVVLPLVAAQAAWAVGTEPLRRWREAGRPLPPAGSPNVLLVVLDTVRADHLSLYGYSRPTSPALERLARRGVRFDDARATAPWTLPSHLGMFTGRWAHELGVKWDAPLRETPPTLAGHLGALGYATAGFAGNTFYCSYDTGFDRDFGHFDDYALDALSAARTAKVVNEALKALGWLARSAGVPYRACRALTEGERKYAHVVNRELLDWLSDRREPARPFFAFVNYIDAHAPYLLPPGAGSPFGPAPKNEAEARLLYEDWNDAHRRRSPRGARRLARDAYDNCLASLDDRLGELLDALRGRGELDRTLVIVTADHGEGLGEHDLFDHGESLYRTEVRVPLVVVPPASRGRPPAPAVVGGSVSLRDVAATVAAFVRPGEVPPFPGRSLLRFGPEGTGAEPGGGAVLSELASPNPSEPNQGRSPAVRGPLAALAEGGLVYIRNEADGRERLFDERSDPGELTDLSGDPALGPALGRFRDRLRRLKGPARAAARPLPAAAPH